MWSGPRNLSTAMMYSFGARPDFAIWDEPFYAPFLAASGAEHPMQQEILAAHETDPDRVERACLGSIPGDKPHFYMKHMPHHMLDGFPLDWARECVNIHLIRHPARVIASYLEKRADVTIDDIGFLQQTAIFERFPGPVVDTADIRRDPARVLARLCSEIGLQWDPAMLTWPAGGRAEDGIWAKHWYGAIHGSTGFAGPEGPLPHINGAAEQLLVQALPHYEAMWRLRLT